MAAGGLFMGRLAATPGARVLVVLQSGPEARESGYVLVFSGLALLTVAWLAWGCACAEHRTAYDGCGSRQACGPHR